jgi:lipoate-protein ligase A
VPLIALPNAFGDAATNMAIDAALLATLPEGIAVFRHYGWTEPASTFGYTQTYAEVKNTVAEGLTLCRRLTGGGIVDHRNDWTYALIIQSGLPAARTPANALYETIHRCIQIALETQLIKSQLAPCPRQCSEAPTKKSTAPDQCFVTPAASDVLRPDGTKIAGAAMKRSREGLLVQGSIDRESLPLDFDYERFNQSFLQALSSALDIPIGTAEDLRALFHGTKIEEERQRFADVVWNTRR